MYYLKSRACLFDNSTNFFQALKASNIYFIFHMTNILFLCGERSKIVKIPIFYYFKSKKWAWLIPELSDFLDSALVVYLLVHVVRSKSNFGYFVSNWQFSTTYQLSPKHFWRFSTLSWRYWVRQNEHHCWSFIIWILTPTFKFQINLPWK